MVDMSSTHDYVLAICVAKADFKVPCSNICYYGTKKCGANQLFATHCAGKWNTVWDQKWWLYYINYSIIPKRDGCSALVSLSSLKVMVALLWLHFHPKKWLLLCVGYTIIPKCDGCSALVTLSSQQVMVARHWFHFHPYTLITLSSPKVMVAWLWLLLHFSRKNKLHLNPQLRTSCNGANKLAYTSLRKLPWLE